MWGIYLFISSQYELWGICNLVKLRKPTQAIVHMPFPIIESHLNLRLNPVAEAVGHNHQLNSKFTPVLACFQVRHTFFQSE